MKRVFSLALVCLLLFSSTALAQTGADMLFATPEEAILAFAARLQAQDIRGALAVTGTRTRAARLDQQKMVETLGGMISGSVPVLPGSLAPYLPLTEDMLAAFQANQLSKFLLSLLVPGLEPYGWMPFRDGAFPGKGDERITMEEYTARVNPERLSGLSLRYVLKLAGDEYVNERQQQAMARYAQFHGYTQQVDYVAVYALEDALYLTGYSLGQFDDGWLIMQQSSPSYDTDATGAAARISEDELQDMLADPQLEMVYQAE